MISKCLNILFLCNKPHTGQSANTVVDHIDAFKQYSTHKIWFSNLGNFSKKLDLAQFDVVIIHYSIAILGTRYLGALEKKQLREFQGLKVVFLQDEYRRINAIITELALLGIDVLFTCFPETEFEAIYPSKKLPKLAKYNNLTGYIPEHLIAQKNQPVIKDRPLHVGYRGRELPYWYGELGQEKSDIIHKWRAHVPDSKGLSVDISALETDRIYGAAWQSFLVSCKATLGTESGASVMDFTGELEKVVDNYQLLNPRASFDEVRAKFFAHDEGRYKLNQISPRCFEAIALKTALVLYEGEYSNILVPNRHYIMLKKDFSNIEEVLGHLKDDAFLQDMVDRAFDEIALNDKYSYKTFVHSVDGVIVNELNVRGLRRVSKPFTYTEKSFSHAIKPSTMKKLKAQAKSFYQRLPYGTRLLIRTLANPKQILSGVLK